MQLPAKGRNKIESFELNTVTGEKYEIFDLWFPSNEGRWEAKLDNVLDKSPAYTTCASDRAKWNVLMAA